MLCRSRSGGGGVGGANFYPYALQHSLLDRVSQKNILTNLRILEEIENDIIRLLLSKLVFNTC